MFAISGAKTVGACSCNIYPLPVGPNECFALNAEAALLTESPPHTVPTLSPQIQTLNRGLPSSLHGYMYALASMATAMALGVIIYGTSIWTM